MSKLHINFKLAESHYSEKYLESANFFRSLALEIDENPSVIEQYSATPIFEELCLDQSSTCLERTALIEALSYGDAGVTLAAPGPSLAGLMIRELADSDQKAHFFSFLTNKQCPTFLAVTEPNRGSDAANMETILARENANYFRLSGEKCFIGHGVDAPIGVLMARQSRGPLGIRAVLLTAEELNRPEVKRTSLEMLGLRGARLGKISLNGLKIKKENILGQHLCPIKGGMMAMMKTFNRMRPAVAAFALGHAQAVLDYARDNSEDFLKRVEPKMNELDVEISLIRTLLYACAKQIDQDPYENAYASLAKLKATELAEKVNIEVMKYFGVNAILHHPLLLKWYRDVFGFEYMEGTSFMQIKNIYQSHINKKLVI